MKNHTITTFNRVLASVLLISQLLTSCGGAEVILPTERDSESPHLTNPETKKLQEDLKSVEASIVKLKIQIDDKEERLSILSNMEHASSDYKKEIIQEIQELLDVKKEQLLDKANRAKEIQKQIEEIEQKQKDENEQEKKAQRLKAEKEALEKQLAEMAAAHATHKAELEQYAKQLEADKAQLLAAEAVLKKTVVDQAATQNLTTIQLLLGNNYVGEQAWEKLGMRVTSLPSVSDQLLADARRLQTKGDQPLLVLDLGRSIEWIERLCLAQGINVLSSNAEKLRAQACYNAAGTGCPRWLLLPGSDHGVLPGSRNKEYDDQVKYMKANYPSYEVGGARELVTLAMLKYLNDGTVLFTNNPFTFGRCKEQFKKAGDGWDGQQICLGVVGHSSPSVFGGLVVDFLPAIGMGPNTGCFVFVVS